MPPFPKTRRILWLEKDLWRRAIKPRDTVMTVFVVDPVIRTVLPLFIRARARPNAVTLLSFATSFLCAGLILRGQHVAAGLTFVLWYTIDCIDGKLARLMDRCTQFGWWLDVTTDRIGTCVVFMALALRLHRGGDDTTAVLTLVMLLVWLLACANTNMLVKIASQFSVRAFHAGIAPRDEGTPAPSALRARLNELRLGRWIVQDIEFMTIAIALGPATGNTRLGLAVGLGGMALQKAVQTLAFWWRRRHDIAHV